MKTATLISNHGRTELSWSPDQRVIDILCEHQIPHSSVSIYLRDGAQSQIFVGLEEQASNLPDDCELEFVVQRNTPPFAFSHREISVVESDGDPVAEYFYQNISSEAAGEHILKKFSSSECQSVVDDAIHAVLNQHVPKGTRIIVGVSGGGDSNALVSSLSKLKDYYSICLVCISSELCSAPQVCVESAQKIAEEQELPLEIVQENDLLLLLGYKSSSDFRDTFTKAFVGEDIETIATLLIRQCLFSKAKEQGADFVVLGANLEDCLGEVAFCLVNSIAKLPLPIREIDGVKVVYPMWKLPKKIVDGCHPKLSLENYNTRSPSTMTGRNLSYAIAYAITSNFPGVGERILDSVSTSTHKSTGQMNDLLGFTVCDDAQTKTVESFLQLRR